MTGYNNLGLPFNWRGTFKAFAQTRKCFFVVECLLIKDGALTAKYYAFVKKKRAQNSKALIEQRNRKQGTYKCHVPATFLVRNLPCSPPVEYREQGPKFCARIQQLEFHRFMDIPQQGNKQPTCIWINPSAGTYKSTFPNEEGFFEAKFRF